ncbi:MAG: phospholipase D family protein [Betaproteobacteria bacterium]
MSKPACFGLWRALAALLFIALLSACAGGPPRPDPAQRPPPEAALEAAPTGPLADFESAFTARVPAPGASGLKLLPGNREALEARLMLADIASRSLDLQYYFWWGDDAGLLLLQRVLRAADRGVKVRLILDGLLILSGEDAVAALDRHPNVEIRLFNAWKGRSLVAKAGDGLTRFFTLNHRMHDKLFVADNRAVILGGRNVGNEYFGLKDRFNFYDLDVIGTGAVVRQGSTLFDSFWNSAWVTPVSAFGLEASERELAKVRGQIDAAVAGSPRLSAFPADSRAWDAALAETAGALLPGTARMVWDDVSSGEIVRGVGPALRALFTSAREDVLITNAYVILSERSIQDLNAMQARGVRLRMLTNSLESHDVPAVNSHYKRWRRPLVRGGAALFELRADAPIRHYTDTPPVSSKFSGLHTKAAVVDLRHVFVGSMNFDPRSSNWNLEMGVIVDSEPLARSLAAHMERDLQPDRSWRVEALPSGQITWRSTKGTLTSQPARGFVQRIEDVLFMLAPSTFY